jgi:protein-disulfide isomerase
MRALLVLSLSVLVLAACSKAGDKSAKADDPAFHRQVVAYLAEHPEVIQEGITAYQDKQHAVTEANAAKAIDARRAAIEHDPRDYVANPDGKITVVEFFDYRCPYCKAALPQLHDLIAANKDVRFVFKEFPILPDADGEVGVSLRASEAAIAAAKRGKYLQLHDAMMSAKPLDDAGIAQALRANGLDPALASADTDTDHHIQDVRELAVAIGATGTPTFVVGKALIEGNRMDQLTAAIAQARKSAKG